MPAARPMGSNTRPMNGLGIGVGTGAGVGTISKWMSIPSTGSRKLLASIGGLLLSTGLHSTGLLHRVRLCVERGGLGLHAAPFVERSELPRRLGGARLLELRRRGA